MTLASMTGFAAMSGAISGVDWQLEARSVNNRGLDLRMRLPEGLERLEQAVRGAMQAGLKRGSVQITLKTAASDDAPVARLNAAGLEAALAAAAEIGAQAADRDLPLAPLSVGDLLANRMVFDAGRGVDDPEAVAAAIGAAVPELVTALVDSRRTEGVALAGILNGQLDRVAELIAQAEAARGDRQAAQARHLKARVDALLEAQDRVEEARLAQELALIAVKSDISEELDRLRTHVDNARALIAEGGAVGRKLDFMMQEFNREANTLCSKAQDATLTEIGLELKVVVDQMREQSANVE